MYDITKSVLGQKNIPANQGIARNIQVPAYCMTLGATYDVGERVPPTVMKVDKHIYSSRNVPFRKMSINYMP